MDPQRRPRPDSAGGARHQPPRGRALKATRELVLLIEADRDAGALLARQLMAEGHLVELACSAEHARALLRRGAHRADPSQLQVGALTVDLPARAVTVGSRSVALRPLEFDLLVHLAREPRRVFARRELLAAVWGYRQATTRTLDTTASRLRISLAGGTGGQAAAPGARSGPTRHWVVCVRGVGYRLI